MEQEKTKRPTTKLKDVRAYGEWDFLEWEIQDLLIEKAKLQSQIDV